MSIVTPAATKATGTDNLPAAWDGFTAGPWQDAIDVRDFIQRNYTPYAGDDSFLTGPTERTTRVWDTLAAMFPEEREKGIYDVDPHTPASITAHAAGLHLCGRHPDRRSADGRAAQARDHAERRLAHGRGRPRDLRLRGRPDPQGGLHLPAQDPQPGRLRRLPAGRPRRAQLAHHHRPSRRLRPRPHHRRLPPRRPLRRRRAHPGEEARQAPARHRAVRRRDPPPARRARRAAARPRRAEGDGRKLRRRHLRPRDDRPRSGAVALLRLPRRGEGAERRGDVARAHLDLPRRVHRARPRRRQRSPSSRRRSSSTTSSSSCASSASSALPSTTSSSPATPPGSPRRSAASARTAARS